MTTMETTHTETVHHIFHAPEIWVILQTLGAVAPGLEVPPEIASDPAAVRTAQANLLNQGKLLMDETGTLSLSPEIEALVRPAAYPETVFIANIADNAKTGKLARVMCFGWTPQALVVNWVDGSNDHHFESYDPQDVQGCIWNHLSYLCNLEVDDPDPARAALAPQELEQQVAGLKQTVMLMAINGIQAPQQTTQALGWFVSGRSAWFMQKNEQGEQVVLGLAGRDDLELAVSEFVEQALIAEHPTTG
jgi:hypothetical protein